MRKKGKWPSLLLAVLTVLSLTACEDWGQQDPPAANDIYPKLEQVAQFTFEDEEFDPESMEYYAYENGDLAVIEDDEEEDHGKILHLPNGYARIFNPLNNVKVQESVSMTFWMKQAALTDEDGNALAPDLTGAIFSFQNSNGTQRMFFTANGWLKYEGVDGQYEANNASDIKTGAQSTVGEWHYVAVIVSNTGYSLFVDGEKRVEKTETNFDFSKIVQFMASTPYLYIGYGSDTNTREMWMDDITIYRNTITSKQTNRPSNEAEEDDTDNRILTVGAEDCTSEFFGALSPMVKMKDGDTLRWGFYNYNGGSTLNWNNWVLVLTNGIENGAAGYLEHFVIRSDAFGWGDGNYDASTIVSPFNWDTFCSMMDGAYVDLTLKRTGNTITMQANIHGTDGKTYDYRFSYTGTLEEKVGVFLTIDHSYLKIDAESVVINGDVYSAGSYIVGNTDYSTPFWSSFSYYTQFDKNAEYPLVYVFYNHNGGTSDNFKNWILCAANGIERAGAGYAEYYVLRSDNFGWGSLYNGDNLVNPFNWDTFCKDMDGAYVRIILQYSGDVLKMTARIRKKADEKMIGDYIFTCPGITGNLSTFLLCEGSYLDIRAVGYMPFWEKNQK